MDFRTVLRLLILTAALSCLNVPAGFAQTRVDIGGTFGKEGLEGFYFSVGDYYRVPESQVIIVRERGVPYYEMPVVFYIAGLAHVAPAAVIDLRLSGRSWMDITLHYRLSPEIYYVPVTVTPGPPYGRAYGHFSKRPRKEWRRIVLSDDDVINLVNLKFTSEYHGYSPDDVIRHRSSGKDFVVIHDQIRKEKRGKDRKSGRSEDDKRSGRERERGKSDDDKGQGRGKGKGHK